MAEIKKGDLVRLKSGGPIMTVNAIGPTTKKIEAVWFDKEEVRHEANFAYESVEKAEKVNTFDRTTDI